MNGVLELDGHPVDPGDLAALGLYNYGHFTTMLVESSGVRGLSRHLERLSHDCRELFDSDVDAERVRSVVRGALDRCDLPVVVRVTVFASDFDLGHPGGEFQPRILVTARRAPPAASPPAPLRLTTTTYARDLPLVKSVGLFATMYERRRAQVRGFDDVLFTDTDDRILEGATWNIGFVSQDTVLWPGGAVLPGVTMRLLHDALPGIGLESRTTALRLSDLTEPEAAFVTNSAVGIRPVASINDVTYSGTGPIFDRIRAAYDSVPFESI